MFDIAPSELMLLAVVALVVIGPKDLPRVMRVAGMWAGRARGLARQFRAGIDEMVRESELAEMEQKWAAENERIMREHRELEAQVAGHLSAPATGSVPLEEAPAPGSIPAGEQPASGGMPTDEVTPPPAPGRA